MGAYNLLALLVLLPLHSCVQKSNITEPNPLCEMQPCLYDNLACYMTGDLEDCPEDTMILEQAKFKNLFDDYFNKFRNDLAGGLANKNLLPAARMSRIFWDSELSHLALLDATRCSVSNRPMICTKRYGVIGSIAAMQVIPDNTQESITVGIQTVIKRWIKNVVRITRLDTLHVAVSTEAKFFLIITQLMIEDLTHYGCQVLVLNGDTFAVIVSCVFNKINKENQRIYQWAQKPGVKCRKRDKIYKNLCAKNEP